MTRPTDIVLQEVVRAAVEASGASRGWLVARDGDVLQVVAAVGADAGALLGVTTSVDGGVAGYVVASSQPLALVPTPGDVRTTTGIESLLADPPRNILCVPCTVEDEALGALEVIDKEGTTAFSFDDVEIVTMLAGIAGAALQDAGALSVADPAELAGELERLANDDPVRYATVSALVSALLRNG